MHRRYLEACPPREGEHQSLAYRLRLLFLDRWNLWHRLTRYRTMRGYKVSENAVRVSRLLAWCGNFLNSEDGAMLAGLLRVKQELAGILTACSCLTSRYQVSNDH